MITLNQSIWNLRNVKLAFGIQICIMFDLLFAIWPYFSSVIHTVSFLNNPIVNFPTYKSECCTLTPYQWEWGKNWLGGVDDAEKGCIAVLYLYDGDSITKKGIKYAIQLFSFLSSSSREILYNTKFQELDASISTIWENTSSTEIASTATQ
jgi:hypothetical protein